MAKEYQHIKRGFGPVFDEHSRVLILGSFPSVKSREVNFFYGHKQNRFWPLLCRILNEELPQSIEEKRALVLRHGIALWDVIEECDIAGSSDSSIKNAVPVDLASLLAVSPIEHIYCNGNTAFTLFQKYLRPVAGSDAVRLPSTSPANAAQRMDDLYDNWKQIVNL